MPYATLADLTQRYGDRMIVALTDRGAMATGAVDATVVDKAIAEADAVIDGYLASRYALPVSPVPALLGDVALAIVIWKLHVAAPDPKIEADYKDALKVLRDIAAGVIRLTIAGADAAENAATGVQVTDRERPFTADNLKGFI